ncbi:MAG: asparagine synthase (glutamine-hydrolyzing), partial [Calditrichaeota bacterium]|nr:asparagine synthase (glutamine-hydrolyzing) [Calditrichota bacterium]
MCGITGVISLANKPILKTDLKRMCDIIAHRGPDDAGYLLFDSNLNFHPLTDSKFRGFSPTLNLIENAIEDGLEWKGFLGHRRLSIIDVSSAGHQPMSDRDKRVWIVFNGEIYNFKELRAELIREGYKFKTQSDTEVLIQAYLHWGINFIHHLNGMFAIGLIDSFAKKVYLIRDRYGIKPLYYCFYDESTIGFSSEIKSLVIYDESIRKVDKEAFLEYFTFQNIFTDKTFFQQVKLLPSASFLEIDLVTKKHNRISYWDYTFQEPTTSIQLKSYLNDLDDLFTQAVKRQMVSDVEVGSFLSGGIDSGAITSIATQYTDTLKTFTIGFDLNSASGIELGFDEREKSEFMSYLYKTEHYEMVLKSGDMERCLQSFSWHLEEPRVGQSYPNFYAAKLAGKFVKVVLSGTGGDELFGGYPWRYYRAAINNNFDDYINKYYNFW